MTETPETREAWRELTSGETIVRDALVEALPQGVMDISEINLTAHRLSNALADAGLALVPRTSGGFSNEGGPIAEIRGAPRDVYAQMIAAADLLRDDDGER